MQICIQTHKDDNQIKVKNASEKFKTFECSVIDH